MVYSLYILVVKTVAKVSSIKKSNKFYNLFSIMLTLLKVNKIVSATFFTDWQVLYFVQINIDYDDGAVQHKEISA